MRKREGNATAGVAARGLAGLVLVVLVPLCAGVFLSNYYRSMNAVMSPRLVAELHLTAGDLGLLTSLYFFTTAIFQAPLGLLMDRYGPRRVQGTLIAIAGVGVLIFAFGQGMGTLMLARAIIGLGGAGALMTAFQAVILWFPPARWPLLNGCTLGIGGLGALAATLPLELVLQVVPWRYAMIGLALASFAASWFILGVVPERPPATRHTTLRKQLSGVAVVYTDRLFWRIAPAYAATTGASFAFQGLWSAPWLKDVGHLAPAAVAANLVGLAVLQTASYVVVGMAGDALGRRGFDLMKVVAVITLLAILCEIPLLLPNGDGRWFALLGLGALVNVNLLGFPVLAKHFPADLIGRANTAVNLFVFVGAFVFQYAIGALIDLFPVDTPGSYPVPAYQVAFGVMVAVQLACWLWYLVPEDRSRAV